MPHRRKFTATFKAQVVLELLSGAKSRVEWCREHQIASSVLADWKAIFLRRAASVFDSPESPQGPDPLRVAELERLVGRSALENDILKKATTILHQRSRPDARSSTCSVSTIPCGGSAVCCTMLGAAIITSRDAGMRHR